MKLAGIVRMKEDLTVSRTACATKGPDVSCVVLQLLCLCGLWATYG